MVVSSRSVNLPSFGPPGAEPGELKGHAPQVVVAHRDVVEDQEVEGGAEEQAVVHALVRDVVLAVAGEAEDLRELGAEGDAVDSLVIGAGAPAVSAGAAVVSGDPVGVAGRLATDAQQADGQQDLAVGEVDAQGVDAAQHRPVPVVVEGVAALEKPHLPAGVVGELRGDAQPRVHIGHLAELAVVAEEHAVEDYRPARRWRRDPRGRR
jgi:hypothetical protein